MTWTAYYANAADAFGTLASPTKTQIATGTFNVSGAMARYSTNISVPSAATTGIEIVFTVGAQTSGFWVIGNVQLELGSIATSFESRINQSELAMCQRYYFDPVNGSATTGNIFQAYNSAGTVAGQSVFFPSTMRTSPSISFRNQSYTNCSTLSATVITASGFTPNVSVTALGNFVVNYNFSASAEL